MEQPGVAARPLIDLAHIAMGERSSMWADAVRAAFPSLSVALQGPQPGAGSIERMALGMAEFCTISSAPAEVRHQPCALRADKFISVMVQTEGAIVVRQAGRCAALRTGDLCLLDEAKSFRLVGEGSSKILFVRVPRRAVLSRYPRLEKLFVTALAGDEPGIAILSDTLGRVARDCRALGEAQRSAMAGTIVHMLGLADPLAADGEAGGEWRVRRALDFIELNLSAAGLTAEMVAQDQNISRRRLDQLMHAAFGRSVAAHLWKRRLEQAAEDLRDAERSRLSIAQIAFANGFEDPAHFTRAFKRRFAVTPGQWRLN